MHIVASERNFMPKENRYETNIVKEKCQGLCSKSHGQLIF